MRKSEFIDRVARKAAVSRATAARAVDAIFDTASGTIAESIRTGGNISLPGFGKFKLKTRAARKGRSPQTGEVIEIPERTVIQFTAGKHLQEALADVPAPARREGGARSAGSGDGRR